jgi:hypothetical protein
MRIYLAGPMRNIPEFNFPAFHSYAAKLRAEGHQVFNPAERDAERDGKNWDKEAPDGDLKVATAKGFDLRVALGDDLAFICRDADAIAVMPGWERSKGATAEKATADALGLRVIILEPL